MHMIFEVTVGFSLAAMLAAIVGLVIAWCWRVAARRVSRGGVAVSLVAIGIATVEAQKNMTNNPPSGVSAPLTETAPSALVCGTPNAVGSETGLCFSGIGTTNGVVRLGFVWPEDGRCSDAIDVFGNWSLTNKQWVFVDMNPDTDGDGKTDGLDERPTQADSGSFAGQSEWWVRTMFPNNCDQILRVGYSSWKRLWRRCA